MNKTQNGHVEAELIGHTKTTIWLRVATGTNSYKVLTLPADIVPFKAGAIAKGTMVKVTTDDPDVVYSEHGFRFAGGIFNVEPIK